MNWAQSFTANHLKLREARRVGKLRKDSQAKREERQDSIYGAALREQDKLRKRV